MSNSLNNIELELRAEVSPAEFETLLNRLKREAEPLSEIKRLSVMFHGEINDVPTDIRVRIKNTGQAEVVIKRGALHSADRTEVAQAIASDQFLGMVRVFSVLGLQSKVTERENFNFRLPGDITFTLTKTNDIIYAEIEKMSNPDNVEENKKELLAILDRFGLTLIANEEVFYNLCKRLDKYDWFFHGTPDHHDELERLLKQYC